MIYVLQFSQKTEEDFIVHKKSGNKAVLKKIIALLGEIALHPFEGTGKPEQLKHQLTGYWSRRINQVHRIIYRVNENIVQISSVYGHYL